MFARATDKHDGFMQSALQGQFRTFSLTSRIFECMSILGKCAVLAAGVLLLTSAFVPPEVHAYVSSVPLALAGIAYTLLQLRLKPRRTTLAKRLVLAGAFLLWAVVQLLAPGRLAVFLGDVVIAAYVLDLFWIMQDQRESEEKLPRVPEESLRQ